MEQSYIILLFILILGLYLKNDSLAIASSVLILLKLLKMDILLPKLEANGLKIGLMFLTIGFLSPLAQGKYSIEDVVVSLKSPIGVSSIISGALVILFTQKGYNLLTSEPAVVIPIIFGSIVGLIIFNGVPVGPLVASGMALVIYNLYKFVLKIFS
ncbi:MAG: hypothetical protein PWQ37_2917 [Candidatus Petromonas sp.]|nr:hypothetical protein [Candidatus Petromonas sp.]